MFTQTSERLICHIIVASTLSLFTLSPAWGETPVAGTAPEELPLKIINVPKAKTDDKPAKGMTMRQVEEQFGKPNKILDAKGKPPITRWVYERFTVYFEGRFVIHAVYNRKLTRPRPPSTAASSPEKNK